MFGRQALLITTGVACTVLAGCQTLSVRHEKNDLSPLAVRQLRMLGHTRILGHTPVISNSVPQCPYVIVGDVDGPQWVRQARAQGAHAILGRRDSTNPRLGGTGTAIRFTDPACTR
jgi:hypothetical protein